MSTMLLGMRLKAISRLNEFNADIQFPWYLINSSLPIERDVTKQLS